MGSRMMHVIIANEVSKRIEIADLNKFLLGSIAVDATSDKKKTHYFKGLAIEYTRHIDHEEFKQEHKLTFDMSYELGYYTHLIADDYWMQGFYLAWIKKAMELNPYLLDEYPDDFVILNKLLQNEYPDIPGVINYLMVTDNIEVINEVDLEDISNILNELKDDVSNNPLITNLNVFTLDQMVAYIESSVDKILYHIYKL